MIVQNYYHSHSQGEPPETKWAEEEQSGEAEVKELLQLAEMLDAF